MVYLKNINESLMEAKKFTLHFPNKHSMSPPPNAAAKIIVQCKKK